MPLPRPQDCCLKLQPSIAVLYASEVAYRACNGLVDFREQSGPFWKSSLVPPCILPGLLLLFQASCSTAT